MNALWRRQLAEELPKVGVELRAGQVDLLVRYLALLQKWNRRFNLTAIRDPGEMVARHLIDSLGVLPWLSGTRLLDVGSGAGLPGIPLAVARPDLEVTLLDSNSKKTRFLTQVALELTLPNLTVVHSRVEAFRPPQLYHTVVSRAFSSLTNLWRNAAHLVAPGGRLIAMKGRPPSAELAELATEGGVCPEVIVLAEPPAPERTLVVLQQCER